MNQKHKKFLEFFRGKTSLLEIGCAYGEFLISARPYRLSLTGADLNRDAVAYCRRLGFIIYEGNILDFLPLAASFDAIYCSNVIEHLSPSDLKKLLTLIALNLSQGGKLGLSTANPQCLGILADSFWRDITHQRLYPLSLLCELLKKRGFRIVEAGPDEDTRPQSMPRKLLRRFRTWLIGDYFGAPEIYIFAVKE